MSVGFADKDEAYYLENGYLADETAIGKAYYPRSGVRITGPVGVRYEVRPWVTRFEIDGIEPAPVAAEEERIDLNGIEPAPAAADEERIDLNAIDRGRL